MSEPKIVTNFTSPDRRINIRILEDYPYSSLELRDPSHPQKSLEFNHPYSIFEENWRKLGLAQSDMDWIIETMIAHVRSQPLEFSIDFNETKPEVKVTRKSDNLTATYSIETNSFGGQQIDIIRTRYQSWNSFFSQKSLSNAATKLLGEQLEPMMGGIREFLTESAKASRSKELLKETLEQISQKSLPEPD